jgi:hypothetical protein
MFSHSHLLDLKNPTGPGPVGAGDLSTGFSLQDMFSLACLVFSKFEIVANI